MNSKSPLFNILVEKAKEWDSARKVPQEEMFIEVGVGTSKVYSKKNAGKIYSEMKSMLANTTEEQKSQISTQLEALRSEAEKGIEQNEKSFHCPAGKDMIACNVLTSIMKELKEESLNHDDNFVS